MLVTYCLLSSGNEYRCLQYKYPNATYEEALAQALIRVEKDKGPHEVIDYRVEPDRFARTEGGIRICNP